MATTDLSGEKGDPRRWVVLGLFCAYSSSNAIQWLTYAPIATAAKEYFNLTTNQLNMLSSVYMIVFAAGAYFTCTTFERWGVRRGVLIGCSLNALGSILKVAPALLYPSYTTAMVSQTINSLAQLFVLSTPPLLAAQYFPPQKRAFATAIAATANSLGNAVGMLVPPAIVKGNDRSQFMLLFCLEMGYCVIIVVFVFFFLKPPSFLPPSKALLGAAASGCGAGAANAAGRPDADADNDDEDNEEEEEEAMGVVPSMRTGPAPSSTAHPHPDGSIAQPAKSGVLDATVDASPIAGGTASRPERRGRDLERGSESKRKLMTWWQRVRVNEHVVTFLEVAHTIYLLFRKRDFIFLLFAFSISMGSVWTFSSVLAQILEPFGVSAELAGIAGGMNVVAGTIMAYLVGLWVDRSRRYKYPVLVCLIGSVLCCIGLMVVMLKAPAGTDVFRGTSTFVYIFAGLFQNTATPICFEFAMEISYPLPESVPGALLMAGANIVSLVLLSISSAMLGDGMAAKSSCVNVIILVAAVCAVGTILAMLPREKLNRREAELLAKEQLDAMEEQERGLGEEDDIMAASPNYPDAVTPMRRDSTRVPAAAKAYSAADEDRFVEHDYADEREMRHVQFDDVNGITPELQPQQQQQPHGKRRNEAAKTEEEKVF